MLGTFLPQRMS